MKRLFSHLILVLGVLALAGSGINCSRDAVITCGNLQGFMDSCYPECRTTLFCELNYDTLPFSRQRLLDECSDCLNHSARTGTCRDCFVDGNVSCVGFLQDHLGSRCVYWR